MSKLVLDCQRALNELGIQPKVTLAWVPEHEGNQSNEIESQKWTQTGFFFLNLIQ